jgi:hypothetical protein
MNSNAAASPDDSKNNRSKSKGHGGKRKGAGRKKGAPNKLTADVKACVMAAFNDAGGRAYLVKVAKEDPRTFCALLGKILPTQVAGDTDQPVRFEFSWLAPSGQ